jgi:hypothetical protein
MGEAYLKLLEHMSGDFFIAIDADDFISVDALQMMAFAIEQNPHKLIFYSDEYKADLNSSRSSPFFKPDFDPVLFTNCDYVAQLMAVNAEFLRNIGSYRDDRAKWCYGYDTVARASAVGQEPVHLRELIYARRNNPEATASATGWTKSEKVECRRFVLGRLLRNRGLEGVLDVEPVTINAEARGMWRLRAEKPVPKVRILDASKVWGETGMNIRELVSIAGEPDLEWMAVLLSPSDGHGLLELSAIALFDPRVTAVCGLLMDKNEQTIRWSGGLFWSGGRIFDPYVGARFSEGGYHGQIWCQRCIDVPAPVNLLVRAEALRRAAARLNDDATAAGLMAMLGRDAQERGELIAVTPHLRAAMPAASNLLPVDRDRLLGGESSISDGSRWYDGRLGADEPYTIVGWPQLHSTYGAALKSNT